MHIDHVVIAVNNLDGAAARIRDRFGLIALPGGTHPMGTANRMIPLKPPQYLELLGVGQEELLRSHPFGERLLYSLSRGDSLLTWAVQVDDINAAAERLQLPTFPGEGHGPDGSIGRWLNVFPDIADFNTLPFFIQYEDDGLARREADYAAADSPARPGSVAWLEIGGDPERITEWLGTTDLPLRFVEGVPPGLHAVAIEAPAGEIVIRNEDL